jgi:hypothetical protein
MASSFALRWQHAVWIAFWQETEPALLRPSLTRYFLPGRFPADHEGRHASSTRHIGLGQDP